MQIVIPLSGQGSRFKAAGYSDLKPLIKVDGMPMVEHVVRMFPGESRFVFICNEEHLATTGLRATLESLVPEAVIVPIAPHKLGPVHAVLQAQEHIRDDEPTLVNYCDFSVAWNYEDFKKTMAETQPAGCVVAYKGFHPHSLGPNHYAYMREQDGKMLEIQEKQAFTSNKLEEFASCGTYYFESGQTCKHYFAKAMEENLNTNGEFYCSMPYNLIVKDGKTVTIYELDHFLQWGTPEDLEEYVNWSTYFAYYTQWESSLFPSSGTNLIPMAGAGERFSREGYADPKPLIPIGGKPMVEQSLKTLPAAQNWICAVRTEHLENPSLEPALKGKSRKLQIIRVDRLTEGQASTCLLARDQIDPEEPLLIAPCDAAMIYDEERYASLTSSQDVDCLVWTFRNHPHANRNPKQYGWAGANAEGKIERVTCKSPLSETPQRDPGIIGTFWFRKARFFLEAADELIRQNRRVNNEFYVDTAIEVLVEQGRSAFIFDVKHYICFGTPDDVRTYQYWERYFRQASHHPFHQSGGH